MSQHSSSSFFLCFCAPKEDNNESMLILVFFSFCFYAPKENDDEMTLVVFLNKFLCTRKDNDEQ
jgi:hypothetical protein